MEKEILKMLSYSACECAVDYKEKLGIVNGICPKHKNSVLLVNGIPASAIKKFADKKVASKSSKVV